ncbi:hypothetical protein BU26DRAFT_20908 [Trematosphaeria pertusa]|uniref:Uncharacterized protein n=1 Tax=Trematosphaeria pertusa TaxID=390896 RepID=A0A6A6J106_9PLEO|nr:uncharacterized protein BU26DRAFT_20908 [Trematosphaeria pertusa]KAF2256389.1 hypothetical protein BU26DRAFT_20908 [Trematosphaeria pertusa]
MMKLTVAFLAALAAADAAHVHGRHVRRDGYGYGGGYGESSALPLTNGTTPAASTPAGIESTALPAESSTGAPCGIYGAPACSETPAASSTGAVVEATSSTLPSFVLPGTGSSSVAAETPSSLPSFPGTGTGAVPTFPRLRHVPQALWPLLS